MRKIFTLLSFSFLGYAASAQLLIEDFNFSGALTANGWSAHSGAGTNPISTTTGLTYTGYANSGIGNAALIGNAGGEDDNKPIGIDQNTDGATVYLSFMVNVTDAASDKTGDYFIHLGNRASATSFTSFAARVFAKITSNVVNFGISNTSTAVYGTTAFAKNTTYLIVVKYTISTAGADPVKMWVLSSGVPATEAAAGTAEVDLTSTGTTTGTDIINAIGLRQGSSTTSPQVVVDGIRISNGWYNAPLPISLVSFIGSLNNQLASLAWVTTNEQNVSGFEIQRSVNGKDFSTISFVSAKGSAVNNNYSLTDEKAIAGTNYYRLKTIDKDGSFRYSQVVTVKTKSVGVSVYPNPVRSTITVQHEAAAKGAVISILDLSGKQVLSVNIEGGATQTSIDASKLAPGSYMVVFSNNGSRLTKQFIKQ